MTDSVHYRKILQRLEGVVVRWLPRAVVIGLVGLALAFGAARLWGALKRRPEFALHASAVSFRQCPPCVQEAPMREELQRAIQSAVAGAHIFQNNLCERVAHKLAACPWVLEVRSVRRIMPNRLEADLVFRRPDGWVQLGARRYVVDRDGYWLPERLYILPPEWKLHSVPVIVDRRLSGVPGVGRPWGGRSLLAGARLNAFLMEQRLYDELPMATINVTNVGRGGTEPEVVLATRDGVTIKWGRTDCYGEFPELSGWAGSNSDATKLAMLRSKLSEYPGLKGVEYIDLRFNKVFFRPVAVRRNESPIKTLGAR